MKELFGNENNVIAMLEGDKIVGEYLRANTAPELADKMGKCAYRLRGLVEKLGGTAGPQRQDIALASEIVKAIDELITDSDAFVDTDARRTLRRTREQVLTFQTRVKAVFMN